MKYDIVIVLCASAKTNDGKFVEFEKGQYLGGQTRMDAAVKLYESNRKAQFILVGGYNKNEEKSNKVDGMQEFLRVRCGENINTLLSPSLPCTRHNLITIFNTWKKKGEIKELKNKKIGLLTNFYHLPRAMRFWSELVNQKEFTGIPTPFLISAESVNDDSGEVHIRFIEYLLRINGEVKGLKDIEEAQYDDKCIEIGRKYEDFKNIISKQKDILLNSEDKIKLRLK